ncbi:MAG: hypothetical protein Q8Q03_03300 [bacterium]|nr:hypothetical protein [bacterium]
MKTYSIVSPSLDGVLSDDYIYFEGVRRPLALFALRDGAVPSGEEAVVLEKYFNDMYSLFLKKLTSFAGGESASEEDTLKLQGLLQELIKVKGIIENEL